jgi:hypothetical protein
LESYLKVAQEDEHCDPIEWWEKNKIRFPTLHKLAFDILCIPETSVPSEQIFSKTGDLITKKRNRLSSKNIHTCMCLDSWLKFK